MWYFFFFKQKTAYEIYQCDWSSDVCSSDLEVIIELRNSKVAERAGRAQDEGRGMEQLRKDGYIDRKSVV